MATSTKPKKTSTKSSSRKTSSKSTGRKTSRKSSGGGGGGGGGGGVRKTNDKAQVSALKKMLSSGLGKARDTKLGNLNRVYTQQRSTLLQSYGEKVGALDLTRKDNEKSESDASFANLGNRARESGDLLSEAAQQGAGETDTLRSQLMAVRNWDANQGEVNRSYFDTLRSTNSAITDLNADTRTAQVNMMGQLRSDQEQVWANYYNQRADAYTQLGNMMANPYSNAYSKKGAKSAYSGMAKSASSAWKNPGISSAERNWQGSVQAEEGRQNFSDIRAAAAPKERKRPEGATLREW